MLHSHPHNRYFLTSEHLFPWPKLFLSAPISQFCQKLLKHPSVHPWQEQKGKRNLTILSFKSVEQHWANHETGDSCVELEGEEGQQSNFCHVSSPAKNYPEEFNPLNSLEWSSSHQELWECSWWLRNHSIPELPLLPPKECWRSQMPQTRGELWF